MAGRDQPNETGSVSPIVPFPITCISIGQNKKYMLYDIDLISWLRKEHHILGVLIGSLPQAPSQNAFLGLPLELMPEEARLLVEKKLAFIAYDRDWHLSALQNGASTAKIREYQAEVTKRGSEATEAVRKAKALKQEEVMKKLNLNNETRRKQSSRLKEFKPEDSKDPDSSLFDGDEASNQPLRESQNSHSDNYSVTLTTSGPLKSEDQSVELPEVNPSSYALFKKLHDKGYFLSPGLRFGCQYMAYPGDPLRYHSHFLAVGSDWDKGIDLIDIIGSGRLATGVKKSFLLGGTEPQKFEAEPSITRAFSIEWAGM